MFSDDYGTEEASKNYEAGKHDAYYGKPPQNLNSDYLRGYNSINNGEENWRWKPSCE